MLQGIGFLDQGREAGVLDLSWPTDVVFDAIAVVAVPFVPLLVVFGSSAILVRRGVLATSFAEVMRTV